MFDSESSKSNTMKFDAMRSGLSDFGSGTNLLYLSELLA